MLNMLRIIIMVVVIYVQVDDSLSCFVDVASTVSRRSNTIDGWEEFVFYARETTY